MSRGNKDVRLDLVFSPRDVVVKSVGHSVMLLWLQSISTSNVRTVLPFCRSSMASKVTENFNIGPDIGVLEFTTNHVQKEITWSMFRRVVEES